MPPGTNDTARVWGFVYLQYWPGAAIHGASVGSALPVSFVVVLKNHSPPGEVLRNVPKPVVGKQAGLKLNRPHGLASHTFHASSNSLKLGRYQSM